MSVTLSSLGLDQLPRAERLELVQALWDSIAAESGPPLLSDARRAELEQRAAEDDESPDDVVTWEDVQARIQARLRP